MRKLCILLDVDGVLADFTGPFLKKANEITGMAVTVTDLQQWDILDYFPKDVHDTILGHTCRKGFCTELPVLPGAEEAVTRLRALGDVYAVTSPWVSETWCHERTQWLIDKLGFSHKDVLHVPGARKFLVRGDVFIDDKLETIVEWARGNPEGLALLWDAPWNRMGILTTGLRVCDWGKVFHAIESVYGSS